MIFICILEKTFCIAQKILRIDLTSVTFLSINPKIFSSLFGLRCSFHRCTEGRKYLAVKKWCSSNYNCISNSEGLEFFNSSTLLWKIPVWERNVIKKLYDYMFMSNKFVEVVSNKSANFETFVFFSRSLWIIQLQYYYMFIVLKFFSSCNKGQSNEYSIQYTLLKGKKRSWSFSKIFKLSSDFQLDSDVNRKIAQWE